MWNPREHQEEDESWEVKAFAEDTKNTMATTWPPRSYSCTFCRREFRSAQALGGHMNVHRRDRARLNQHHPSNSTASSTPTSYYSHPTSSFINIPPHQELVANGRLCLFYRFPAGHNNTLDACGESPSNLPSVSSYSQNNLLMPTCSPQAGMINGFSSYSCISNEVEEPTKTSPNHGHHEELDLELRLGHRSTPS